MGAVGVAEIDKKVELFDRSRPKIGEGHVPDEVFEQVRKEFSDEELIDLTLAVATINSWNRLNIAFRTTPGTYQPGQFAAVAI